LNENPFTAVWQQAFGRLSVAHNGGGPSSGARTEAMFILAQVSLFLSVPYLQIRRHWRKKQVGKLFLAWIINGIKIK
jgi:hypothetical protein